MYGHRRNPTGYYECLREFDGQLSQLEQKVRPDRDLVILTADHGNDPTMPGTDHTREYIPLLAFGPSAAAGVDLGIRETFADIGATIADIFDATAPVYGTSFLSAIT
jgi:phosphopentomutase